MQYPAIWGKIIQYSGECKVHETHDFSWHIKYAGIIKQLYIENTGIINT
jgi:hypothetical protein